jgi:hypothetical protein
MEEGDMGEKLDEEELPSPDNLQDMKVKVIKPFKPGPRVARIVRQGKCYYHPAKPASYICSSCGKSICSVCAKSYGDVFFCPQCTPLEIPRSPPAVGESESAANWYRALFTIGVIFIIIGSLFMLAYWPLTSMNAAEFENLQEQYLEDGGHNFKDYTPGDVIVIRDEIVRIEMDHDPGRYGVMTRLWFKSTGKGDNDFHMAFDADLERDYKVGDTVSITLHVDEDSRTHDEVIREYNNNLPDISNIDQTLSIDLLFYSIIIFGVLLIIIYVIFTNKMRRLKTAHISTPMEIEGGKENFEGKGLGK